MEVSAIKYLIEYELFGQKLHITSTHITLLIVMIALIVLAVLANRKMKHPDEVPGLFQNILEIIVEKLDGMVSNSMGSWASRYRNYIGTIFAFILVSNLSGVFGLRAPTADFGVTFALGLATFFIIQVSGVRVKKLKHFKAWGEPYIFLLPSNIIGDVAVPVSLSLRLFANMLSGTMIMSLWYGMLQWIALIPVSAFLHAYLDVFSGAIQTYVFAMLTMTYINDKIN